MIELTHTHTHTRIDISIWLQRIIKASREGVAPATYLRGLFIRICKLLFFRIRPVFVFDGPAPLIKRNTLVCVEI
jgi:DNA excision repair protein ERCC-5